MAKYLVIVESPAKAKTIKKYLGSNYDVVASMGHIRDLPKSRLGVSVEDNYEPNYINVRGKADLIKSLKKASKKSEKIFLATDPDREGEAISWHLAHILGIDINDKCRVEFNEITKTTVKNSIKNARSINLNLVNAQQARRVVDRLVGYGISPVLWKTVKPKLSAGRVQSAALKLICDRENEISKFQIKQYFTIEGHGKKDKIKYIIKLHSYKQKKIENLNEEQALEILKELSNNNYVVKEIKSGVKNKRPLPPFTTSTLQQDAYKKLNFQSKKTMSVAQTLYEGVEIKGHGTVGLITYMRTDSVRLSNDSLKQASEYIDFEYGDKYRSEKPREYSKNKNIQDAHEAIRPTNVNITPDIAKQTLRDDQYKLYSLIWKRFLASQMSDAVYETMSVSICNGDYLFKLSGSILKFDGFLKVYNDDKDENKDSIIPKFKENEELEKIEVKHVEHFTQPPPRYTESSFVKLLEEKSIGRPSTYVPTISTLFDRMYIKRQNKQFIPTELGVIVNDLIKENFTEIVDVEFTADMEKKLDFIEEGRMEWKSIVHEFYEPFKQKINIAENTIEKIVIEDEITDVLCEKCGRNMVKKHSRFGMFLACPAYPECRNTKSITKELNVNCPKCNGKIYVKKSKKGKLFYGCEKYPECDFVSWYEPTADVKCPKCGGITVKKKNKKKQDIYECIDSSCESHNK